MKSFSRSLMLLCFGTAIVLGSTSWQRAFSKKSLPANQKLAVAKEPVSTPLNNSGTLSAFSPPEMVAKAPVTNPLNNSVRLVVDLSDRHVYLYQGNQVATSYPVAIGQRGWETPTGTFAVKQKLLNPAWFQPITGEVIPAGANNPLGERWIGFWSDGRHQIGFHGTNQENLIGQAVTHGCLRMRNRDIRALYAKVSMGTPVTVRQ